MIVGKQFTFEASHCIVGHPTCGVNHGHTWTLDVKLEGSINPKTGMLIDFKLFGGVVKDLINKSLDHKYLNDSVPLPILTCETLVCWITNELAERFQNPDLCGVLDLDSIECSLQEGPGGYANFVRLI